MSHLLEPKAHVLIEKNGKFLFLRRFNTGCHDGCWCLPTGRIEKVEGPKKGAVREVFEEVGLKIDPVFAATVCAIVPDVLSNVNGYYEDLGFFFYAKTEDTPINCEPEKHDKMEWFSLDDLPNPLWPFVKFGIECYLKKQTYGEFGYL